ncbi:MAG: RNA polymerase sigma factor [Crocinitomicaceae bacterium]|nr:RNA polymerase sigma factor [Crocinitomicaceae bacterium]
MDELTIVDKCVEGDQMAQRKLFEMFAPKMLGVCLRYAKNREQAEDVLQDGFVKVFTKIKAYKKEGSLEGWIRRIMVNTSLDQIRKNAKFMNNVSMNDIDYKVEFDGQILSSLMEEDLLNLIKDMPVGYRMVFNMFAIEGYSHKEIAEKLSISENTSKSQYSRAKAYLRIKIEELGIGR